MSDKSIAERLQVKRDRRLAVIDAPGDLDAMIGATDARAAPEDADVVLLFVPDRARFSARLDALLPVLAPTAILWLAYPKLTSALASDLNRDIIHNAVPAYGLSTVSMIAIDADWSAMRLKRVG